MRFLVHLLLVGYKRLISPMLPVSCRYFPTCSEYAMEAVDRHGAWRGSMLAATRLLRCHPFAGSGYDPVPEPGRGGIFALRWKSAGHGCAEQDCPSHSREAGI